jgi:hypothetical protein
MKVIIDGDGNDLFVIADGVKIAKRGRPGTPQVGTWVSIEPGWTVRDYLDDEGHGIEIEYGGVRVRH